MRRWSAFCPVPLNRTLKLRGAMPVVFEYLTKGAGKMERLARLGSGLGKGSPSRFRAVIPFTKGFRNEVFTATQASAAASPSNHT